MTVILKTHVTAIGEMVEQLLQEDTLILFDDTAPQELQDISVLHSGQIVNGDVQPGDTLRIGEETFEIYFVGDQANKSIRELGHVTFKFNGNKKDMPGSICTEAKEVPTIETGTLIQITR